MTTFTREDFEHAARAAGIGGCYQDGEFGPGIYNGHVLGRCWCPPDDDGDALRLASKLRIHLLHNDDRDAVLWVSAVLNRRGPHGVAEFQDEAQRADATRHAIFRAAIVIGRAMP